MGDLFRVDAEAEGDTVVPGGWSLREGARLVSAFDGRGAVGQEPYRIITTLEILAGLVGLLVFALGPSERGDISVGTLGITGGTVNQGNSYLFDRFMTTQHPLGAVPMEVGTQLQERGLQLRLGWLPREANQPTDDLTNGQFERYTQERRFTLSWGRYSFRCSEIYWRRAAASSRR